jgi:hypothetical protein
MDGNLIESILIVCKALNKHSVLIKNKKANGREKDLNDIQQLKITRNKKNK